MRLLPRRSLPLALAAGLIMAAPLGGAPAGAAPVAAVEAAHRPATVQSAHGFAETVDRLTKAIESRGAKVAATVDHAKAAGSVDMKLRPTTVVIFGNPKLGTPLMQTNQTAGLDLPLRVLVWEDEDGKVNLGYWPPAMLAELHGADPESEAVGRMAKAVGGIVAEAAGKN